MFAIETWHPKDKKWSRQANAFPDRAAAETMARRDADVAVARGEVATWKVVEGARADMPFMYGGGAHCARSGAELPSARNRCP